MSRWEGAPELGDEGSPAPASPAIVSVTGTATGLTVVTEPILPSTLVDFLINGVAVEANQRTTVINLVDDGTNPLAVDTDYEVTTQAHNGVSPDPAPSAGVTARLDPGMTSTAVYALLAAGFIIANTVQVGSSMTLDGVGGLTITQTDGRQTYMRADGSGNQFIGQAILDAAVVLGGISVAGASFLSGPLTVASGVSDPTGKPGVTAAGWDSVTNTGGANYGIVPRGLFDNTTTWVYTDSVFNSGNVNSINKGTGARTVLASLPTKFNGVGGVVKVGTSWYVLGQDNNRGNDWWVFVFNTSWVKTAEWATGAASSDSLSLGIDGAGGLLIAKRTVTDSLLVLPYTTAGVLGTPVGCGTWAAAIMTGVFKAAVDTATVRFVVTSTSGLRVFNTSTGARVTGEEWTPAGPSLGIGNDATNWFTLDLAKVWKYTNLIGTYDFAFDWADDDNGGSSGAGTGLGGTNTARTKKSALRTVAPTKRAKWTISLPSPPPDDGTTDGANTATLYAVATGGTLVLQTPLVEGAYSATYSTLATSGTAPSTTNGFAARLGAVGEIKSSGGVWDLLGDNSGKAGWLSWDTAGVGTQDNVMATASGNAAPTSTTNVTIPGISATVTSPGTNAAWMIDLDCDVLIGASAGGNIVGLLIDGAEHASLIVSAGAAAARFAATKRYRITGLSAGSHTFTARTRSQGAYTTTVNQTHSTMTVERCA